MPDGIGRHAAPRCLARLPLKGNPVELSMEELRTVLENAY